MRNSLVALLAAGALSVSAAFAQTVTLPIGQTNVDLYPLLNAHSVAEYEDLRGDLIEFVWKGVGIPTALPAVYVDYNANRPAWLTTTVDMRAAHVRDAITTDVYSVIYILEPVSLDGDCLFVYNFGHSGRFLYGPGPSQGERDLINARLAEGCDVVLSFMPFNGDNLISSPTTFPTAGWDQLHDYMASAETPSSTPIRYFLNPPIVGINWAIDRNGAYGKIGMAGLSGGGWTTALLAALDTRVTHSYSIAGSMPTHIRLYKPTDIGDWEQSGSGWLDIADYMDLYILGALEPGRHSMQIWNTGDTCCFTGDQAFAFINQLRGIAGRMGVDDVNFHVSVATGHIISSTALFQIAGDF